MVPSPLRLSDVPNSSCWIGGSNRRSSSDSRLGLRPNRRLEGSNNNVNATETKIKDGRKTTADGAAKKASGSEIKVSSAQEMSSSAHDGWQHAEKQEPSTPAKYQTLQPNVRPTWLTQRERHCGGGCTSFMRALHDQNTHLQGVAFWVGFCWNWTGVAAEAGGIVVKKEQTLIKK